VSVRCWSQAGDSTRAVHRLVHDDATAIATGAIEGHRDRSVVASFVSRGFLGGHHHTVPPTGIYYFGIEQNIVHFSWQPPRCRDGERTGEWVHREATDSRTGGPRRQRERERKRKRKRLRVRRWHSGRVRAGRRNGRRRRRSKSDPIGSSVVRTWLLRRRTRQYIFFRVRVNPWIAVGVRTAGPAPCH